ncbi:hypothetical protein BAUCODRAFT_31450 [Baudoinia panamericana UAMH 10762]|uniref:Coronin n=1 Tax=Baudoinia panamericana (strain UAMH 10762) TaxID=717646 RepID=M2NID6_BAUPA|nr:uncharacterized protein BAUCODRAFT_31450 [Baudoinia panamericana UAMH 10762]EMC99139.1 hypothetical protein BAUCODRAFT_31450 [Baudoinia panamericana UAMH 10762]
MSGRFVRASKYRHVFGRPTKREACYDNLRISKNAWDTNLVKANPKYLAVNWDASGGGAFAVIPLDEKGKLPEQIPLFRGHTATVLDTDWSPFDDDIVASASDDGKVFLWKVPEDFSLHTDAEEPADVKPVGKLSGHSRKVGHVLFNPSAQNILASSSGDYTVKIWDLEDGKSKLTLKHGDIVQSLSWSANGSTLVTTSRDKKLRFWDVRQEKPAHVVQGHEGAKSSRCVWLGDHDRVATTGFSKMSERQLGLWDLRDPSKPVGGQPQFIDSSSGVAMPFWDDGTQILFVAGKGDGNIRYYEYENDKFEDLSEYKSSDPQRGLAFIPKRGVNMHENEIMRAFKTVDDRFIEPISFIVPRRSETFQDDIYPPTVSLKPAMTSSEWLDGKSALPPKFSMEDMYDGKENLQEFAAEDAPKPAPARTAAAPTPAPASAPAKATISRDEKPEATPAPSIAPRETPSMQDNKKSMSDMASKFADREDDEEGEDGGADSFEVVQKPVERPGAALAARQEAKVGVSDEKTKEASRTSVKPEPEPVNGASAHAASNSASVSGETVTSPPSATTQPPSELKQSQDKPTGDSAPPAAPSSMSAAAGGLRDVLQEIRGMLQAQGRQIEQLTSEVAQLKAKVGD